MASQRETSAPKAAVWTSVTSRANPQTIGLGVADVANGNGLTEAE